MIVQELFSSVDTPVIFLFTNSDISGTRRVFSVHKMFIEFADVAASVFDAFLLESESRQT